MGNDFRILPQQTSPYTSDWLLDASKLQLATLDPGNKSDRIRLTIRDAHVAKEDYCVVSYDRSQKVTRREVEISGVLTTIPSTLHDALVAARSSTAACS